MLNEWASLAFAGQISLLDEMYGQLNGWNKEVLDLWQVCVGTKQDDAQT